LGWHVVVHFDADILEELVPFLEAIPRLSSSTILAGRTSRKDLKEPTFGPSNI
jgi:hypothetical protein